MSIVPVNDEYYWIKTPSGDHEAGPEIAQYQDEGESSHWMLVGSDVYLWKHEPEFKGIEVIQHVERPKS